MDKETQDTLAGMDARYIVNVIMLNRELVTALAMTTRYVELSTGDGARTGDDFPEWALNDRGVDADAVAAYARKVLDKAKKTIGDD